MATNSSEDVPAESTVEKVEEPTEKVEKPMEKVEEPKEKVEEPKEKVEEPKEKLEEPKEKVEEPTKIIENSKEKVETPADNSDPDIPEYLKLSAMEHDQAVEQMKQEIEKEVSKQLLVGDVEPISVLKSVYAEDDLVYQAKIQEVEKSFTKIRRIRQDGNCFFRSFGFSLMEQLISNKSEIDKITPYLAAVKNELIGNYGYPEMTVEDFYDNFMEVIEKLKEEETDLNYLLKTYQDSGLSDYLVCFMRLVVSAQLNRNPEFYLNFIGSKYPNIKAFLSEEVEPMYVESDHMHVSAVSDCLNIKINVLYMDRGKKVVAHNFQEKSPINVTVNLLYRPGHYDVLYA